MNQYVIFENCYSEVSGLYWNNDSGWTSLSDATVFNEDEKNSLNLPINGDWIKLPKY